MTTIRNALIAVFRLTGWNNLKKVRLHFSHVIGQRVDLITKTAKAAQLRMQGNDLVVPVANSVLSPSLDGELEQSATILERLWRVSSITLDAIASVLASTRRLEDQRHQPQRCCRQCATSSALLTSMLVRLAHKSVIRR